MGDSQDTLQMNIQHILHNKYFYFFWYFKCILFLLLL